MRPLLAMLAAISTHAAQPEPRKPPEPWQAAGLRAALDDPSPALKKEALHMTWVTFRDWTSALVPSKVAILLSDREPEVVFETLTCLSFSPENGIQHVPKFIEVMRAADDKFGDRAASAVGTLGRNDTSVYRALIPLLSDNRISVRNHALSAFGSIGENAAAAAPEIVSLLSSSDESIRFNAAVALGSICAKSADREKYAEAVADTVTDFLESPTRSKDALRMLGDFGFDSERHLKPVIKALTDKTDGDVAAEAIAAMCKRGVPVIKHLVPLLSQQDPRLKPNTISAIGLCGKAAEPYTKEIAKYLDDADDKLRWAAAYALMKMAEAGLSVEDELISALKRNRFPDKREFLSVIRPCVARNPALAEYVVPFLHDGDHNVRTEAGETLMEAGDAGIRYYQEVLKLLGDEKYYPSGPAKAMLQRWARLEEEGAPVREALIRSLKDPNSDVRRDAVEVFDFMGPMAERYVSEIAAMLEDSVTGEAARIAEHAAWALQRTGPKAEKYAPEVAKRLKKGPPEQRARFALILSRFATADARHTTEMLDFIHSPDVLDNVTEAIDRWGNQERDINWQAKALAVTFKLKSDDVPKYRAHLYVWSGHDPLLIQSVQWLGKPDLNPDVVVAMDAKPVTETFEMLLRMWEPSAPYPELRQEICERAAWLAETLPAGKSKDAADQITKLAAYMSTSAIPSHHKAGGILRRLLTEPTGK